MGKREKALAHLRENDRNVRFEEVDNLLCSFGCSRRMRGSHATYSYPGLYPITVPFRKPFLLPIYVRQIVAYIEQIYTIEGNEQE